MAFVEVIHSIVIRERKRENYAWFGAIELEARGGETNEREHGALVVSGGAHDQIGPMHPLASLVAELLERLVDAVGLDARESVQPARV